FGLKPLPCAMPSVRFAVAATGTSSGWPFAPGTERRYEVVCAGVTATEKLPSAATVRAGPAAHAPPAADCSSVTGRVTPRATPVSVTAAPAAAVPAGRVSCSSPNAPYVERRFRPLRRIQEEIVFVPDAVVTTSWRAWPFAGTGVTSVTPATPSPFE